MSQKNFVNEGLKWADKVNEDENKFNKTKQYDVSNIEELCSSSDNKVQTYLIKHSTEIN